MNPWGNAFFPGAAFWINDNGTGLSALYNGDGTSPGNKNPALAVTVPVVGGGSVSTPSGIVANTAGGVQAEGQRDGGGVLFLRREDGSISAWNGGLGFPGPAELEVDNSSATCPNGTTGSIYKGLAEGETKAGVFLYATNFFCGTVDVFDGKFNPAVASGGFKDTFIPPGYAPFGIQNVNGKPGFITYAKQDAEKHDDAAGRSWVR